MSQSEVLDGQLRSTMGSKMGESRDKPDLLAAALEADVNEFKRHRATIEQAKGVLMQLLSIDPDQAFAVLSRHSQTHNIKLRTLAERLTRWASEGEAASSRQPAGAQVADLLERLAQP